MVLAEATGALGGRVALESRLPGLSAWIRVLDYRKSQLERLGNVELAFDSELTARGDPRVRVRPRRPGHRRAVARATASAAGTPSPLELSGAQVLTPDDLMAGRMPSGKRVVLFDDDHYYMGGVLAELLATAGHEVTLVTPEARVSDWTQATMEQHRIQKRLLEAGVTAMTTHTLVSAAAGSATVACAYTEREQQLECDALVLVTSRLPSDALLEPLLADGVSVRAIGDAHSPGTIAAAVWDGRRFAEELDDPAADDRDRPPFLREVVQLAPDEAAVAPGMIAVEPWQMPADGLAAAIRRGELSAVEALESVLDRADAIAPALNPFAVRLDDQRPRGGRGAPTRPCAGATPDALAGVPVTIKDSQWLAGVPSPAGSLLREDFVPAETCGAVQRLIDAGAVIYATTTTPEFCLTGHDGVEAARADAQPLGSGAHARRVVRRRRRGAGRRRRAAGAGRGRRRLDPHPVGVLRAGRVQAE